MVNESAIRAVFESSLKLKPDESCLIATDTIKEPIGRAFSEYAQKITSKTKIIVIEPTKEHAEEPPESAAKEMLDYDVQILVTEKSLTHTKARIAATKKGARIATMPTITEDIANRCLDIDYGALKEESRRVYEILKQTTKVRVTTELGTDITLAVGQGGFFGQDGGSFDYPGAYGNLPEGEVSFSPATCNGAYVVDASFPDLGLLDSPLTFKVKDGKVYEITGSRAEEVIQRLDRVGPKAYVVAELGIGLNPKAKIIGNILEDEKVIGTVHIAVGNNLSYGGNNDVPLHLDGVITSPDMYVDGKRIIEKGTFLPD
ncbi:MAG: aminopeptidase [Candidatus Omnitrophota bacterium]